MRSPETVCVPLSRNATLTLAPCLRNTVTVQARRLDFLKPHFPRYFFGISAPATYMSFAILHIWYTLMRKSGHVLTRQ